ncbi:MAG: hypothetical protein HY791_31145 [Deltaproteobacteria bacterium]|nr:hypothetical protein [Deltaproteobacteria bacterium]
MLSWVDRRLLRGVGVLIALGLGSCGVPDDPSPEELIGESAEWLWTTANCPTGMNVIEGTKAADVLVGTPGDDCILGYDGDDVITAGPGNDVLVGGPGRDTLRGEDGNDRLYGQADDDDLDGGDGKDELDGGKGNDTLRGGLGNDVLSGGDGADQIFGEKGDDYLSGREGDDFVDGGEGADRLLGGPGDDQLEGGFGPDSLQGGSGDDSANGGPGEDRIGGGEGADFLRGGPGLNQIDGGDESDDCGETTTMVRCESPSCPAFDLGSAVGPAVAQGNTAGALDEVEFYCAGPSGGGDVQLAWTAPSEGVYVFDTFGSDFDTTLQILDGLCNPWTPVLACNDDVSASELASRVGAYFYAGQSATIDISGYSTLSGHFVLNVSPPVPDLCPDGDLGSMTGPGVVIDTTLGAGDTGAPPCAYSRGAGDRTYTFTAPADGRYAFSAEGLAFNAVVYVSDGCNSPNVFACGDSRTGTARAIANLVAGQLVFVTVDGVGTEEGDFTLSIEALPPPLCPDVDLGSALGTFSGDTRGAQDDFDSDCFYRNAGDLAYTWTAPSDGQFRIDLSSWERNQLLVLGGTCEGFELSCGWSNVIDATAGQLFTFVVDATDGPGSPFDLKIEEVLPVTCPDQSLGSAVGDPLVTGTLEGARNSVDLWCTPFWNQADVVYEWVAPSAGRFRVRADSAFPIMLASLADACWGPIMSCTTGELTLTAVFPGQVFELVVESASGGPAGEFSLSILEQVPPPCPSVDLGSAVGVGVGAGQTLDSGDGLDLWCGPASRDEFTFSWTAPSTGRYRFEVPTSSTSAILAVLQGLCPPPDAEHVLACNRRSSVVSVVEGQTYTVVVESAGDPLPAFTLDITELVQPPCPTQDLGSVLGPAVAFGAVGTTSGFDTWCYPPETPDVTFLWTAPADGEYVMTVTPPWVGVAIFAGACDPTNSLVCSQGSVRQFLSAGQTVTLVVENWEPVDFTLGITAPMPPVCPTQDLGSATGEAVAAGSTVGLGSAFSGFCRYNSTGDVSFTWTAPLSGRVTFDTTGSNFPATVDVLMGDCFSPPMTCEAQSLVLDVIAGQTYTVVVDGEYSEGDYVLNIRPRGAGVCPTQDLGSATGAPVLSNDLTGEGSAFELCGGWDYSDQSYLWTAPSSGEFRFRARSWSFWPSVSVLGAACGGDLLACQGEQVLLSVIEGQTYTVVVDGSPEGPYDLDILPVPPGVCPTQDLGSAVGVGVGFVDLTGQGSAFDLGCHWSPGAPDGSFVWTAPTAGFYRIVPQPLPPLRYVLVAAYDAACGGRELGCTTTDPMGSPLVVSATEGQVFTFVVEGASGSEGPVSLDILAVPPGECPTSDLGSAVGPAVVAGATASLGSFFEPTCDSVRGRGDASYTWTAPEDGVFELDINRTTWGTVSVHEGDCAGPELSCNWGMVAVPAMAGQVFTIVIESAEPTMGAFELDIRKQPPCPDFDLGSALGQVAAGSTFGALNRFWPWCAYSYSGEHTYAWTAPSDGVFVFDTRGSQFDTVLQVADSSCFGPVLTCNDNLDPYSMASQVRLSMRTGQTVVLMIDGVYGSEGEYVLNVSEAPPGVCPTSDLGSAVGPGVVAGTTASAGSAFEPTCGSMSGIGDASYTWTAPEDGTFEFDISRSAYGTVSIHEGLCDGPELNCGWGLAVVSAFAGQVFTIVVEPTDARSFELDIRKQTPCPDADLGSATGRVAAGTTFGAANRSNPWCSYSYSGDRSYSWTAPRDGTFVFDTVGSRFDTILEITDSPSCFGPGLGCNDNPASFGARVTLTMYAGQTVVVTIDGYADQQGDFVLDVNEAPPGVCPTQDIGSRVGTGVAVGDTRGDGSAFTLSCSPMAAPDNSFVWVAPSTGNFLFDTRGSGVRTAIEVLDGNCPTGAPVRREPGPMDAGIVDPADSGIGLDRVFPRIDSGVPMGNCGFDSVEISAIAGQVYTIVVEGLDGIEGKFALNITELVPGVCPTADLGSAVGRDVVMGTTRGAGSAIEAPCGRMRSPDQSYLWVAPASGRFVLEASGGFTNWVISVNADSCSGPFVGCGWYGTELFATAGQTYVIAVEGADGEAGDFSMSITDCASTPCTPDAGPIWDTGVPLTCSASVECPAGFVCEFGVCQPGPPPPPPPPIPDGGM